MSPASPEIESATVLLVGDAAWFEPLRAFLAERSPLAIERVSSAAAAIEAVGQNPVDCVVTTAALPDDGGVALIERLSKTAPAVPVVLCATDGSERLASDAIAAGVAEYEPIDDPAAPDFEAILDGVHRTLQEESVRRGERTRALQFEASFRDHRTATWVLDAQGSLTRANETASEMLPDGNSAEQGALFWTLPWWTDGQGTADDVRQLVDRAREGTYANAEVMRGLEDGESQVLDLSARPVRDEDGTVVSVVVDAADITERVTLEQDLRESEELHRVTLNNMTETVLITDDGGEYTYVCPNVHFIFGYTPAEIRELGGIEALLGSDPADHPDLAAHGVRKNIECTATDKAGREHTLLVNVRQVSIQGGTLLYSCRDVTARAEREAALATLQETAREFLYAGSQREIAQRVVDETPEVLGVPAAAVYLFDPETNRLQPAASAGAMERLHGPLSPVEPGRDTLTGECFVTGEGRFVDDIQATGGTHETSGLHSAVAIPLGDRGVFLAGSAAPGAFDEVTQELADLLAATAEAALDRVQREEQLKSQDRELQRRNDQLTRVNRINDTIRDIAQALVQAETREEIDHTVCERLTTDDRFAFAWIGLTDHDGGTVTPQAWAGSDQGYLDTVSLGPESTEPAVRATETGEVTLIDSVTQNLRSESWRTEALARDYLSVLSIPLTYNDVMYGVLTVYADTQAAFDETVRTVLQELGETTASAISGIERKNALLTTSMTRVEFAIEDDSFLLSRLVRDTAGTVEYRGGARQTADGTEVFLAVEAGALETVIETATELVGVDDVQRISEDGNRGLVRLSLADPFLALELADHGAVVRSAAADSDGAQLCIDIPETVDIRHVAQLVRSSFAGVSLRSKQTVDSAATQSRRSQVLGELTDRQFEVVQTAYYSGFFESPRASSGEEIAATLGFSSAAFYQHIRTVQRKVFGALFEEQGADTSTTNPGKGS